MSIDLSLNEAVLDKTAKLCRERGVRIPTFAQQRDPASVPAATRARLAGVPMNDTNPVNLFRITWKNEPVISGGGYNSGNWIEFPESLTGVPARLVGVVGAHFPTGAHKVGAAFGCLVPRLVTGQFDPTTQKAVWPSTGNYCRGGAFDSVLLGCTPVAILPEEMSRERFDWLREIGAEVIATPGCESNVKEIYDMCWEIRKTRKDCVIFNQFEEFGNALWHYSVTGPMMDEIFQAMGGKGGRLAGFVAATGSAGTINAGDFLRTRHPHIRIAAAEALQCPTLLANGFGGHRIEGIGDKHVPWIHNVRNTDVIAAIDDEQTMNLMRLFNEPAGRELLIAEGVPEALVKQLGFVGISGLCNMVAAIKMARHFEMDGRDVIVFPLTDSMCLYNSRLQELAEQKCAYTPVQAARDHARWLQGIVDDHFKELTYEGRKALHNLKYFTWVEQQGRTSDELRRLWDPDYWTETFAQGAEVDKLITEFNARVGLGD